MTLSFIGLCCCVIAFGLTVIICELLYEVHKEIRKGNIGLVLTPKKAIPIMYVRKWAEVVKGYEQYQTSDIINQLIYDWNKEYETD